MVSGTVGVDGPWLRQSGLCRLVSGASAVGAAAVSVVFSGRTAGAQSEGGAWMKRGRCPEMRRVISAWI